MHSEKLVRLNDTFNTVFALSEMFRMLICHRIVLLHLFTDIKFLFDDISKAPGTSEHYLILVTACMREGGSPFWYLRYQFHSGCRVSTRRRNRKDETFNVPDENSSRVDYQHGTMNCRWEFVMIF